MKRIVLVLFSVTLLSVIAWQLYVQVSESATDERTGRRMPKVAVEIQPILHTSIADIGAFTGSLKPKSSIMVAPKVSGRLFRMMVNVGDQLIQNQEIARLDDAEYQQELQQAEAYLEVAKANLEAAQDLLLSSERELERIKQLRDKNLISASELDTAKSEYTTQLSKFKVAKAQLNEKEAAYEVAKIRLSYTRINNVWSTSDSKLVVGERYVDEGALLNSNTPIISIMDISSMVGVIHVTEGEYFKVQLGQEAKVTVDALKDQVFSGKIVRIAPLIKVETREAQIELEIDNPTGILKPGLFIRVAMQFANHQNVTVIPLSAMVKRNEITGVFIADLEKESVSFVKIQPGIIQNEQVEVLSPAINGSVVTLGHHLLEDGSPITIPGQSADAPSEKRKTVKN